MKKSKPKQEATVVPPMAAVVGRNLGADVEVPRVMVTSHCYRGIPDATVAAEEKPKKKSGKPSTGKKVAEALESLTPEQQQEYRAAFEHEDWPTVYRLAPFLKVRDKARRELHHQLYNLCLTPSGVQPTPSAPEQPAPPEAEKEVAEAPKPEAKKKAAATKKKGAKKFVVGSVTWYEICIWADAFSNTGRGFYWRDDKTGESGNFDIKEHTPSGDTFQVQVKHKHPKPPEALIAAIRAQLEKPDAAAPAPEPKAKKSEKKKAEAEPEKAHGSMSALDAAAVVLKEADGSLPPAEIYARMDKQGYWKTDAKFPVPGVRKSLNRDIVTHGVHSRFCKDKNTRGYFRLSKK